MDKRMNTVTWIGPEVITESGNVIIDAAESWYKDAWMHSINPHNLNCTDSKSKINQLNLLKADIQLAEHWSCVTQREWGVVVMR
jgi:hypothetical protein